MASRDRASNSRPRIVFFTGLGCDDRLIAPQRGIDADLDIRPWIEPLETDTLASYAKRLAAEIDTDKPLYLAGISLGGMIALEVAQHVKSESVILIASCRSYEGVPVHYRILCWAGAFSPLWLIDWGKRVMPHVRRLFGILDARQVKFYEDMLADADARFIRWSLRAILTWGGTPKPPGVPVFHVHGRADRILPLRLAGRVDHIVERAGHVVNVSHAREVNEAINRWLASGLQHAGPKERQETVSVARS